MDAQPVYSQVVAFGLVTGTTGAFVANRNLAGGGVGGVVRNGAGSYSFVLDPEDIGPVNNAQFSAEINPRGAAAADGRTVVVNVSAANVINILLFTAAGAPADADFSILVRRVII